MSNGDNFFNWFIAGLFIGGIIFGAFCAFLAKQKNRNSEVWFVLGFFFSLIALIVIAASPAKEKESQLRKIEKYHMKF